MISVIIPVYNVEPYLRQCVDSVAGQTYRDLQIILVDDGSTDGSGKICDEYAERDLRVQVLHKKNGGLSEARNAGMSFAAGEYISFVDSDDYIHPQMMELFLKFAQENDADMVTCRYERDDEDSFSRNIDLDSVDPEFFDGKNDFDNIIIRSNVVACCRLYKKKVLEGFSYPVGKLHEDEYIHRILFKCQKVVCLKEKLYFYRVRENSITGVFSEKRVYDGLEAYEDRITFALENNWTEIYQLAFRRYAQYCKDTYEQVQKCYGGDYKSLLYYLRHSLRTVIKKYGKKNFEKDYVAFSKGSLYYVSYKVISKLTYPLSQFLFRVKRKLRSLCKK